MLDDRTIVNVLLWAFLGTGGMLLTCIGWFLMFILGELKQLKEAVIKQMHDLDTRVRLIEAHITGKLGVRLNFDIAFERLLGHEGAYVNDPNDPGGETKWGISKRSYPNEDIPNLTKERAKELYRRDFWNRIGADDLQPAVAFNVFDFAVNSGIGTAIRYLQRAVGVADDGHWGPISSAAAASVPATDTIFRLSALRLDYMTRLQGWGSFSRGWARRLANNMLYAAEDT